MKKQSADEKKVRAVERMPGPFRYTRPGNRSSNSLSSIVIASDSFRRKPCTTESISAAKSTQPRERSPRPLPVTTPARPYAARRIARLLMS